MTGNDRRLALTAAVAAGLLGVALSATGAAAHHKDGHDNPPKDKPAQSSPQGGGAQDKAKDKPKDKPRDNRTPQSAERGTGTGTNNGNPGTIKVAALGSDTRPDTEPHPGCAARVDFYNFNPKTYLVEFTAIAPTAGGVIGGGTATITAPRTGGDDVQLSKTFALDVSGLTPANQGYHVKVRVMNPDKPGNGAKSKVFWIDCVPAPAAVSPAVTTDDTTQTLGVRGRSGTLLDGDDTAVLGVRLERAVAEPKRAAVASARAARPGVLPFTGGRTIPFLTAAALLLAVGTGLVVVSRQQALSTIR